MIFLTYNISVGLVIGFLYLFFPMKINDSSSELKPPTRIGDIDFSLEKAFKPEVDRLVFVVIDALRNDFITENNVPFMFRTANSTGCVFTVRTHAPTVTLPRIKSLTVGNIPQFADVVLNFAATEEVSDSFLHRVQKKGKKLVFYGDDTWLKLFPKIFHRSEGVSSFFVNDFYEVDNNVTKSLTEELKNDDWDVMFLHYLGLDHIGHVYGPYSSLIAPKLHEMDRIVQQIYNEASTWKKRTVIAVTGDHGMKDNGGHGGSTHSEIMVPFIVLGAPCDSTEINQIDIPVTLSYWMGIEIASGSIGKLVTTFKHFNAYKILYTLRYNAEILLNKSVNHNELFLKANHSHYRFLKFGNLTDAVESKELYENCLDELSKSLSGISNDGDDFALIVICVLLVFSALTNIAVMLIKRYNPKQTNFDKKQTNFDTKQTNFDICLLFLTFLQPLTLLSSSFVEEEHQIWYFYTASALVLVVYSVYNSKNSFDLFGANSNFTHSVLIAIGFCFAKKLNQTGDKYASEPDVFDWLALEDNYVFLQTYTVFSFCSFWFACHVLCRNAKKTCGTLIFLITLTNYVYRIYNVVYLAKLMWALIFVTFVINVYYKFSFRKNLILTWLLVTSVLLRAHNVLLLSYCVYFSKLITRNVQLSKKSTFTLALSFLWLGNVLFFSQGHSNSISSVDVASGYVGLDNYEPLIVVTLVLCHTYTFPVLAVLLLIDEVLSKPFKYKMDDMWCVLFAYRLVSVTLNCVSCLLQRQHLFIWTVFAPKLLVEASHCVVLCVGCYFYYICVFVHGFYKAK